MSAYTAWHAKQLTATACEEYYKDLAVDEEPSFQPHSIHKIGNQMIREIMELDSTFNFGKHAGDTLEYTIDKDPGYIEWLVKNNVVPFTKAAVEYMDSMDIEMTGA